MTREQWRNMNAAQRRIKLAKLAGWTGGKNGDWIAPNGLSTQCLYPASGDGELLVGLGKYEDDVPPDFCLDLNAINDAESKTYGDSELFTRWQANLILVCGSVTAALRATAEQRAEALALTMEPEA